MDQMYGSIWQRGVLSTRDRMLIAIALTAHTGMVDTLQPLFELAPNVGVTVEEIREIILTVGIYGGWPRALESARRFDRFVAERETGT
jgi:4-carboxymuconolactone decarboxylase